ncbi:uncharacterized protein [Typha latifolia]|uniref:uncharacterized protein n=1 Tax=Typha latifolia TaxID=4733 RepID=UPI003C2EF2AD
MLPPPRFPTLLPSPSPSPDLLSFFASFFSFLHSSSPLRRRRRRLLLLNPSPMPNSPPPPHPPSLSFSSPESLAAYLTPLLPSSSLSSWGVTPGTKTLTNLFIELVHGETLLLHPSPPRSPHPIRAVHVASVNIRNPNGALLVESHQLLSDGSVRERWRPLSEKMRPGESIEEAAVRAVREEIGEGVGVRVLEGTHEVRVEERESASYPGLKARYVVHSVEARVEGLPAEGEFETEESGEGVEDGETKAVAVRRHYWKWVDGDCSGRSRLP